MDKESDLKETGIEACPKYVTLNKKPHQQTKDPGQ